jgi:hypothetical protein
VLTLTPRDPDSTCPAAQTHARFDAASDIIAMLLVLAAALLETLGGVGYTVVVVVLSVGHTAMLAAHLPHFSLAANQLRVTLSLVQTWAALCMAMAESSAHGKVQHSMLQTAVQMPSSYTCTAGYCSALSSLMAHWLCRPRSLASCSCSLCRSSRSLASPSCPSA